MSDPPNDLTNKPLTGKQQAFVDYYLGEARYNGTKAAKLAGYRGTNPELAIIACDNLKKAHITKAISERRAELRLASIAAQEYRLDSYVDDFERLNRLIEARAADQATKAGPGGDTGLIVRQFKIIGNGRDAQVVEEFAFDAAVITARQNLRKQIAQELGQFVDKKEFSGDGVPLTIVFKEVDRGPK
jgi:phage terminase small subunit